MSSRLPPLNPLRAFEATARHGSVSAAGRELNVTHGAISHQIRTLEESLGVRLFERGGKWLKLTSQGALLMPVVSNAFSDIAAAKAAMTRPSTGGTLRVTCVAAVLSLWLIPRLQEFTDQYPDIQLDLRASNEPNNLNSPNVDLCILYGSGNWPNYWSRLWSRMELFPVVSPALMNRRPLRSPRDLRDHMLLHADRGNEWNTWLTAAGIALPARQHMMSDARLSIEAAMHGHGVALGDNITTAHMIARGELIAPFDLTVPANDAVYVACRTEAHATPIVRVFIDWFYASLVHN
ncbi:MULTISPECIES: LysR substrate-binding domain-containing protein [Rhizobium]|jgi:LysR family glycine cleavage system transcriptional activator|uniref:HTH-type transcriptional regulator TtuA n=1 Tax=Rhizobium sophoriradicis TaxID=1535245 RepID=A0A2A5KJG2_9HYPH|nr:MULTISPECIES: LysR substrate-binding domain-containing protein [Rhizobium]ARQ57426.1 LysR family transcriptional regulator protein [Rhizobium sp. Kim5]PCK77145.1 LysR family transcriptional regulator [Rhizobium sophoriradicis]RSB92288.1 LysR family transcriptional regulator [Rhizobium sophoriradicis]